MAPMMHEKAPPKRGSLHRMNPPAVPLAMDRVGPAPDTGPPVEPVVEPLLLKVCITECGKAVPREVIPRRDDRLRMCQACKKWLCCRVFTTILQASCIASAL
jgi:hypothetical protein